MNVDNDFQIEVVNQHKEPLLRYLKKQLNNSDVILQTKVVQNIASPPVRNMQSNDKYQTLLEKNPLLDEFKQKLGLEINF